MSKISVDREKLRYLLRLTKFPAAAAEVSLNDGRVYKAYDAQLFWYIEDARDAVIANVNEDGPELEEYL